MPGATDLSRTATLPEGYQEHGGHVPEGIAATPTAQDVDDDILRDTVDELEDLPVATVEAWLEDETPVTKWVRLRNRKMKVLVRGLTEEERQDVETKAPSKPVRRGNKRVMEKDQQWINLEVVRRSLLEPQITDPMLLKKALAGELAYLATAIGEVSGFEINLDDALD